MKTSIALLGMLFLTGCATLSEEGSKVHLEIVQKSSLDVDKAKKKLEGLNCKFIKNIEASIAAGSTPVEDRLIIGLKNKTAEEGGNAVISSLEAYTALPIYTKGIIYLCPITEAVEHI